MNPAPKLINQSKRDRTLLYELQRGQQIRESHPGLRIVLTVLCGRLLYGEDSGEELKPATIKLHDGDEPLSLLALEDGCRLMVALII